MRWNATEIVAVRQQQDKTLPLKRPVLSAWLIQMALPLLAASCCVGHVPRAALVLLRGGGGGGRGWRRLRHRPYRSRLEAYAKLCFLLFQCLENAAAFACCSTSFFCSFAFCLLFFPCACACACLGSAFFMVKSCWWRVSRAAAAAVTVGVAAAALQLQFSRIRICSKQIYMEGSVRAEFINAALPRAAIGSGYIRCVCVVYPPTVILNFAHRQ